jgi:CubicO group peptidase (beta-lactamase class C family)
MRSTGFHGAGWIEERLALGYTRPEQSDPAPLERYYHSPSSPLLGAEGLLGTASDLAQWLLFHLNRGKAADRQWMQPSVFDEMYRVQYPELAGRKHMPQSMFGSDRAGWGLGWISWPCGTDRCIAHTGSTPGYTAILAGNLDRKTGVAIVTNSDSAQGVMVQLALELMRVAESDRASSSEHSVPTRQERSEDET